jgi:hypothetical protein
LKSSTHFAPFCVVRDLQITEEANKTRTIHHHVTQITRRFKIRNKYILVGVVVGVLLSSVASVPSSQTDYTCYGVPYDAPDVCSGQGDCVAKDTCICYGGFYGEMCEMAPPPVSGTAVSVNGLQLPSWVGFVTLAVLAVLGVALLRRRRNT